MRLLKFSLAILLCFASYVPRSAAQGVGFAQASYPVGAHPSFVITADFNGDGRLDLAVANAGSDSVSILLGKGDGTFGTASDFATGTQPSFLAVGDLNSDGKFDLVTVGSNATNTMSVLLGNGDGTFNAKTDFATGNIPRAVAVGDFNGDGKLDVAVANTQDATVSILLGNGDGTFGAKVDFPTGRAPEWIVVADFNGDGQADVATADGDASTASVLLGNGDGTLGPPTAFATDSAPLALVAADFRNLGKLDLATANVVSTISLLLGEGNGTFDPKTDLGTDTGPIDVLAADFNADGKLDLLTTNVVYSSGCDYYGYCFSSPSASLSLLEGNGVGTFGKKFTFTPPFTPTSGYSNLLLQTPARGVAQGDFNSDGRIDLAIADTDQKSVVVLLQAPALQFNPGSLKLGEQRVGTTSPPQSLSVSSTGSFPLNLTSVSLDPNGNPGDFAKTADNCTGATVPAGASCVISLIFTPTALGDQAVNLIISDNVQGSPQMVGLSGRGVSDAIVSLSPTSLSFASQSAGTASPAQSVTLTNNGGGPLGISSTEADSPFKVSPACGSIVAAGASCTMSVTFNPTDAGSFAGRLLVDDDAAGNPHTVALSGTATAVAPPDFAFSGSTASQTISAGQAANYTLTIAGANGFTGTVSLSCSDPAAESACSLSANSITLSDSTPVSFTATVSTTARSVLPFRLPDLPPKPKPWVAPSVAPALSLILLAFLLWKRKDTRRRVWVGVAATACVALLFGCGGGATASPQRGTPSGTYMVTVTATSGGLSHSLPLTLTVR